MREMETLTPCKIKTFKQTITKFVKVDYVDEQNVRSIFGENQQGLLGKQVKCNFL